MFQLLKFIVIHHKNICNDLATIVTQQRLFIYIYTVLNTTTRYTAENLLISYMALLYTIASTHCNIFTEFQKDELKNKQLQERCIIHS